MRTRKIAFMAFIAMIALPAASYAQPEVTRPDQLIGSERRAQSMRINVDVDGVKLGEVMERIGQQVGRNILVDPSVDERVTVSLREIAWRDAVDVIAKMTRCEVEERAGGILLLTQPPKVTIQFTDANVRTVLQLLAAYSGKNIIISPDVQGRVTLDLKEVHWLRALHAIVKTVGDYEVVQETEDLLRVVPRSAIETQLETRVFRLKYVRPPAIYRAIPPATGSRGSNQASATVFIGQVQNTAAANVTDTFTLYRALAAVIQASQITGATMEYDEGTNSFVITATRPLINQIQAIINRVDVEPAQIYAEIKFVSIRDNNFINTGLDFTENSRDTGLRWTNQEHGPFPLGGSVIVQDPFNPGSTTNLGVGEFPFFIGEGFEAFNESFNFPAILNPADLDLALNLIDRDDRARTIQTPSLFMLDNQDAVIFVGEQVPYATLVQTPDANGNVNSTLREGDRSPVAVGFSLFIQPHVVPDSDRIYMTVIPRVNELSGGDTTLLGFDRFNFGGVGLEILLPRTREQAVVTHIMLDDTTTAVLGGLVTESDVEVIKRVPIISSLPVLGNLFTNSQRTKRIENLTIFITPTIVRQRRTLDSIFMRATRRLESMDWYYNRFEKPIERPEGDDDDDDDVAGDDDDDAPEGDDDDDGE